MASWTMAMVISCPSIFAIIVFLLGALVFLPMSENSVKKWSYSCLQEDLKITSHAGPTDAVGQISAKNRKYEDGSWPPMYGEESPSWEFFISGAVEAGHLTSSSDDQRWYDRLLRQADLREGCEKTYTRAFKTWDNEIVGELYNDPGSLTYAEGWEENKNNSVAWIGESCKKRLNGKLRTRKLTAGKPTNSSKWGFAKLKHAPKLSDDRKPIEQLHGSKDFPDGHGLFNTSTQKISSTALPTTIRSPRYDSLLFLPKLVVQRFWTFEWGNTRSVLWGLGQGPALRLQLVWGRHV